MKYQEMDSGKSAYKNISPYALMSLAQFYGATADYLLELSETKNHPNAGLADLRLGDDRIDLLKSGRAETIELPIGFGEAHLYIRAKLEIIQIFF